MWINVIDFFAKSEGLKDTHLTDILGAIGSAYSMHPNEYGAKHYAKCVNDRIKEISKKGTISGKICKAPDKVTAISNATIEVYKDGQLDVQDN